MAWTGDPAAENAAWVSADYTLMWLRGVSAPPLVTTSAPGVASGIAGVLGQGTTSVLLGGDVWDARPASGFQLRGGMWLRDSGSIGFEAGGFLLPARNSSFSAASDGAPGSPSLGRPFIEVITGQETVANVAFPGQLAGSITADLRTQFWGADFNVLMRDIGCERFRTTLLVGLRYLDLQQNVFIQETSAPLGIAAIPFNGAVAVTNPDLVRVTDQFRTHNEFIGGQFGLRSAWDVGQWNFGLGATLALGGTHQVQNISALSEIVLANGTVSQAVRGGLLANSSNIGIFSRNVTSLVPEAEVKVAYRLTQNLSVFASYNFLFWTELISPSSLISRSVDLTKVPTSALFNANAAATTPLATRNSTNFWANSLQFGLVLKF